MIKHIFDFTGLKCPLPVLKARRALKPLEVGTIVLITADDPAAMLDFQHFCETAGHELIEQSEEDSVFSFKICKNNP